MARNRLPRLGGLELDLEISKRLTSSEKLAAGRMLFDAECRIIRERIRKILPDANEELELDLVRLAIRRIHDND